MCVCIFYKLLKLSQSKEEDIHTPLHWESEASPTLGCSIEILRVIYIYIICRFVCLPYAKMCRRNYTAQTSACSKSVLVG